MSANSKIEWTDASWNPIRALNKATGKIGWFCIHDSPGCINCYAETFNERLGCQVAYKAQERNRVEIFVDQGWDISGVAIRDRVEYRVDVGHNTTGRTNALTQPSRWKKPRVIFVCSMTDLFGDFVTDAMIDAVMVEIAANPRHTFIVLTKRSKRMREYFERLPERISEWRCHAGLDWSTWPLPNLWLMVSAEDQRRWDQRVPDLIATPAIVRGVSVEPQIERIVGNVEQLNALDWIIQGGESGPGARPFEFEWAHSMEFSTSCTRTHYFLKQVGSNPQIGGRRVRLKHSKGGDPAEWPSGLRVRQRPPTAIERMQS